MATAVAEVTFLSNSCRPVKEVNPNSGETVTRMEVFKAGQTYKIALDHPHLKEWLKNRNCYHANEQPPQEGPFVPEFLSSKRSQQAIDDENSFIDKLAKRLGSVLQPSGPAKR